MVYHGPKKKRTLRIIYIDIYIMHIIESTVSLWLNEVTAQGLIKTLSLICLVGILLPLTSPCIGLVLQAVRYRIQFGHVTRFKHVTFTHIHTNAL